MAKKLNERQKTTLERQRHQIEKLPAGGPQLDVDAPENYYEIDRAIKGKLWNGSESAADNIQRARRITNCGIAYAYSLAEKALVGFPARAGAVRKAYAALAEISSIAEAVEAIDPFDVISGGARFGSVQFLRERAKADAAFRTTRKAILAAADRTDVFLKKYPPQSPTVGNSQWLARGALFSWAWGWLEETGYRAGGGKTGPFITYAAAAWADLKLEAIDQNGEPRSDDLVGWLGQLWSSQTWRIAEVSRGKSR